MAAAMAVPQQRLSAARLALAIYGLMDKLLQRRVVGWQGRIKHW